MSFVLQPADLSVGQIPGRARQGGLNGYVDNRSGVQLAAAQGSAKNWDFGGIGGMLGSDAAGAVGAFATTPQGKLIAAAFIDSYDQLVRAVCGYRAQDVRGGLGKGGQLKVGQ